MSVEVKRVVIYGIVNAADHRDYATIGEWSMDLYERPVLPTIQAQLTQRRSKKTGRFLKGKRYATSRTQYRDPGTGRFVKAPLTGPKPTGGIPDDDTIVADVLRIIEDETGHRLYRTPGMRESGQDRVSIGIQHLSDEELKRTYTYAEFLRELRHRAHNEWVNR